MHQSYIPTPTHTIVPSLCVSAHALLNEVSTIRVLATSFRMFQNASERLTPTAFVSYIATRLLVSTHGKAESMRCSRAQRHFGSHPAGWDRGKTLCACALASGFLVGSDGGRGSLEVRQTVIAAWCLLYPRILSLVLIKELGRVRGSYLRGYLIRRRWDTKRISPFPTVLSWALAPGNTGYGLNTS